MTLKDSAWVLSFSISTHQEILEQPKGTTGLVGLRLSHPERTGDFVRKPMDQCTGAEILEETLRHLRFDDQLGVDHGVIDFGALQFTLRQQYLAPAPSG